MLNAQATSGIAPGCRHRILVVDDYADALDLLALVLRQSGFEVATSATGTDALRQATERPPDLLILDLQLPDIAGLEVARRLRHHPATAALPIIALTGRAGQDDADAARRTGIDLVVVKPCDPPSLVAAIRQLIGEGTAGAADTAGPEEGLVAP